jgi:lysophospholipase L1-like esterase
MIRYIPFLLAALLWAAPSLAVVMPEDRCATAAKNLSLGAALPRVAERIARGKSITVVAIGSSSTAGAGASDPNRSYPGVLETALGLRLRGMQIKVINKGVNGDIDRSMVARFDRDVFPHRPHLVVWQVGANAVLREDGVAAYDAVIRDGVRRLKASGADVVLMDLQYAPRMLREPDYPDMEAMLGRIANDERVGLFHRFAIMRSWVESGRMTNDEMLSPDGLHLNDLSYGCVGRLLAQSIVEGAERNTARAGDLR